MAPRTPSRSTRYSVKPRATADMSERRAKKSAATAKSKSLRKNTDTLDARTRVARSQSMTNASRQFEAGANRSKNEQLLGQDTRYRTQAKIENATTGMRNTYKIGANGGWNMYGKADRLDQRVFEDKVKRRERAAKKAAGAKIAAKKQGYR